MKKTANRGFTLVEVIVVLVILGIIAAVTVPAFVSYVDNTNERTCLAYREKIVEMWEKENLLNPQLTLSSFFNTGVKQTDDFAMLSDSTSDSEVPVMSSLFQCPSGGVYSVGEGKDSVECSKHGGGSYVFVFDSANNIKIDDVVKNLNNVLEASGIYLTDKNYLDKDNPGLYDALLARIIKNENVMTFKYGENFSIDINNDSKKETIYPYRVLANYIDNADYNTQFSGKGEWEMCVRASDDKKSFSVVSFMYKTGNSAFIGYNNPDGSTSTYKINGEAFAYPTVDSHRWYMNSQENLLSLNGTTYKISSGKLVTCEVEKIS